MMKKTNIRKIFVMTLVLAMTTTTISLVAQAEEDNEENIEYEINPIDKPIIWNKLFIDCPSSVMEGEQFYIVVTAKGRPIENALVLFHNRKYYTNANGSAIVTAPLVKLSTKCNYQSK